MSSPEAIRPDVVNAVNAAHVLREQPDSELREVYEYTSTHARPVTLPQLECIV